MIVCVNYCLLFLSHLETNSQMFGLVMAFNATFSNISVILWWSVLLVEETGENHRPVASHWQTLSHDVVSTTPHHWQDSDREVYIPVPSSLAGFWQRGLYSSALIIGRILTERFIFQCPHHWQDFEREVYIPVPSSLAGFWQRFIFHTPSDILYSETCLNLEWNTIQCKPNFKIPNTILRFWAYVMKVIPESGLAH